MWRAGFALTCYAESSSSCMLTMHTHLFLSFTERPMLLSVQLHSGRIGKVWRQFISEETPAYFLVSQISCANSPKSDVFMPPNRHPFSAAGKHFSLQRMGYFWQCGIREWAMVVMERQQGVWFMYQGHSGVGLSPATQAHWEPILQESQVQQMKPAFQWRIVCRLTHILLVFARCVSSLAW